MLRRMLATLTSFLKLSMKGLPATLQCCITDRIDVWWLSTRSETRKENKRVASPLPRGCADIDIKDLRAHQCSCQSSETRGVDPVVVRDKNLTA